MSGIHKTHTRGADLEFMQYRSYQPGDDLRWLDWKMYGRSDRFYIRESEKDSSISVRIMIDASASMDHEDQGIKKIEYARYMYFRTVIFFPCLQKKTITTWKGFIISWKTFSPAASLPHRCTIKRFLPEPVKKNSSYLLRISTKRKKK